MRSVWPLQDAKNKFSAIVEGALKHGPQMVTRHGKETVVILAASQYSKLRRQRGDLIAFFRQSPLYGCPLDLRRSDDIGRKVKL